MEKISQAIQSNKALNASVAKYKQQRDIYLPQAKEHWQRLSDREKLLLAVGAAFILILIVYKLILTPLSESLASRAEIVQAKQNDVQWMEQQLPLIEQLRQKTPTLIVEDSRPFPTLVEQTLTQNKLREMAQKIAPDGDDIEVWMEKAPFAEVIKWLNSINRFGIAVKRIDVTPHEDGKSLVNISLILKK